jgi:hypothetical protein
MNAHMTYGLPYVLYTKKPCFFGHIPQGEYRLNIPLLFLHRIESAWQTVLELSYLRIPTPPRRYLLAPTGHVLSQISVLKVHVRVHYPLSSLNAPI